MSEIRVGLIGYGSWTRSAYVPALERIGNAKVAAVAAVSEASRGAARDALGGEVVLCDGYERLISDSEVDVYMVGQPDSEHEVGLAAVLRTGKPVFYEAPVAHTRVRTRPALRTLLSARQLTHADIEIGFAPVVVRAAEIVASGVLGRLRTATMRTGMPWGGMANWDLCTINHLTPWYVDPLSRILGALPRRALVLDGAGKPGRMQNQSTGVFDYDGVWGILKINIDNVGPLETVVEVNGDEGDLIVDLFAADLRLRTRASPEWETSKHLDMQPRAAWPGMHECVQAFFVAVEHGGSGAADAHTLANLQLVGLAAEESVDTGTWAEVDTVDQI